MFRIETAKKEQVKLMIGLVGPSGSGKTLSALKLAHGIAGDWEKVLLVDSENKSSLNYAGARTGDFKIINFDPAFDRLGFNPANWIKVIEIAEKDPSIEVLILDSISHEWIGKGGCLELMDQVTKASRSQNSFTAWKEVTPKHNAFIDKMRNSRLHIIATIRSKQEWVIEKDEKTGKNAPKKVGMKPEQRDGIEYEFSILFDVNMEHYATTSKDRTGLFFDRAFIIDETIGAEISAWSKDGRSAEELEAEEREFRERRRKEEDELAAVRKEEREAAEALALAQKAAAEEHRKAAAMQWLNEQLKQKGVPEEHWQGIAEMMRGRKLSELDKMIDEYAVKVENQGDE